MLTEVCQYLRNWFVRDKWIGTYSISNGVLLDASGSAPSLLNGQYYRIIGSVLNDGVHKYGDTKDTLLNEPEFEGAVWSMAVPPILIGVVDEMAAWQEKYGGADSAAMSPFQSESFGGYSFSKAAAGGASGGSGSQASVFDVYAARLSPWRKI